MRVTLRWKILGPSILLLALSLGILAMIAYSLQAKVLDQLMQTSVASSLGEFLNLLDRSSQSSTVLRGALDRDYIRIANAVASVIEADPRDMSSERFQSLAQVIGVDEIHITDDKGVLSWGSVPGFFGFDFTTTDQTKPFLAILDDPSITMAQDPQPRGSDGALFQYISVSRRDRPGIVQIGVQPTELQSVLQSSTLQSLVENVASSFDSYLFIMDTTGHTLAHTNPERAKLDVSQEPFIKEIVAKREGTITYTFRDVEIYAAYKQRDSYIVVSAMPVSSVMGALTTLSTGVIITLVVSLITSAILLVIVASMIVNPVRKITSSVASLSSGNGDLTVRIPSATRLKDETTTMVSHFNEFLDSLSSMIKSLLSTQRSLKAIGEDLSAASVESAAAVTEILATVESVNQRVASQSASVAESSASVTQVARAIDSMDKMIASQVAAITQASASVEEMVGNISAIARSMDALGDQFTRLASSANEGRDRQANLSKVIREVASQSEILLDTNTIIADIAAQTNLLAMNAAIEAAHAGDKGRGFAVVADEIRKLAESSAMQTSSIKKSLASILQRVEDMVAASKVSEDAFSATSDLVTDVHTVVDEVRSALNEQTTGSREVLEALKSMQDLSSQVRSASGEMRTGSHQTLEEMDRLLRMSQEIRDAMSGIASGSAQINASVEQTSSVAQSTRAAIDQVDAIVSRFKV